MVQNVVYKYSKSLVLPVVNHLLPEEEIEVNVDDLTTNRDKIKEATKAALFLTVAGCLTEVITRPFTVITLRTINCSACWSGDHVQLSPTSCEAHLQ